MFWFEIFRGFVDPICHLNWNKSLLRTYQFTKSLFAINPKLCCLLWLFREMSSLCFDTIGAGLYDSWCVFEWNVTLNNNTFFYLKIKYCIKNKNTRYKNAETRHYVTKKSLVFCFNMALVLELVQNMFLIEIQYSTVQDHKICWL